MDREMVGVSQTPLGLRTYMARRGGSLSEIATIATPGCKAATISTAHPPTSNADRDMQRAILTLRRNEYARRIRRDYDAHRISVRRRDLKQLVPRTDGKTCPLLTMTVKDNLVLEICGDPQ